MLSYQDLINNFSDVVDLSARIVRFADVLPKSTIYYYLKFASEETGGRDLLLVSEGRFDDQFAKVVFASANASADQSGLSKVQLAPNDYTFTQIIVAPPRYHAYMKGRLDTERENLFLCVPAWKSEFSGDESVEEFFELRRNVFDTTNWNRPALPKVILRFDNPKTGAGTAGRDVLVRYSVLQSEIENLDGVASGFVEVANYDHRVIEILSPAPGEFVLIHDHDDGTAQQFEQGKLLELVWSFLTE